ncbi:MAG TPA: AAA family ATPase [Actinomycetota bacterium]|nr:AAA family ATPase [Actinomycetota bacterium]
MGPRRPAGGGGGLRRRGHPGHRAPLRPRVVAGLGRLPAGAGPCPADRGPPALAGGRAGLGPGHRSGVRRPRAQPGHAVVRGPDLRVHRGRLPSPAGLPGRPGRHRGPARPGLAGVGGFSLGMRQRLGLAAALLGDPDVLVLDEPANGLDPEGVHWLRGLVRGLADQGRTVLVSSHLLAEVAQTVDQVVIIDRGRLVAQSTLAALTAGADRTVRVRTAQPEALRDLLVARGATVTLDATDQLLVGGATAEQVGQAAAAGGVVLHEMRLERSNLEDVFLELTGGKGDQS